MVGGRAGVARFDDDAAAAAATTADAATSATTVLVFQLVQVRRSRARQIPLGQHQRRQSVRQRVGLGDRWRRHRAARRLQLRFGRSSMAKMRAPPWPCGYSLIMTIRGRDGGVCKDRRVTGAPPSPEEVDTERTVYPCRPTDECAASR